MILLQKIEEVGGRLQQTRSLFMQHVGNASNGNFSCSFPLSEFCWWWDLVFFKLLWSNKYLPQNWDKYPVWLQVLIYIIALWQQIGEDNKWRLLWWLLAMMCKPLPDFFRSTPVTVLLSKWDLKIPFKFGEWAITLCFSPGPCYQDGSWRNQVFRRSPKKHGALSFRFGRGALHEC